MRAYSELTRYSCPELSGEDELTIFWGFNFFPKFVWFGKFGKGFLGVDFLFPETLRGLGKGVVGSMF